MYRTQQEQFWAGEFGDSYAARNDGEALVAGNLALFSKILSQMDAQPASLIEFGANIGLNLRALHALLPTCDLHAIEINETAADRLRGFLPSDRVYHESILDFSADRTWNVALIKGVLIHVNPELLSSVYDRLYRSSDRYVVVCEYYSANPETITYRGHADRLFKRDFAGEMLDRFDDLRLVDYGFQYHRDRMYPADDLTWFVLEKLPAQRS